MKSTFHVNGDREFPDNTTYELTVCFNGVPDTVILEVERTRFSETVPSVPTHETVVRAVLKASEARAVASAILSAATEVKR